MEKEFVEPAANAALKKKWVEALRSGNYRQHRGSMVDDYAHPKEFCCLGVAAHIISANINSDNGPPYIAVRAAFAMGLRTSDHLMRMNDIEGRSFAEIADWIETHALETGDPLLQAERSDAAPTPLSE